MGYITGFVPSLRVFYCPPSIKKKVTPACPCVLPPLNLHNRLLYNWGACKEEVLLEADTEKDVWGGVIDCRSGWGNKEDADTTIK
jgi:hypothetical protein